MASWLTVLDAHRSGVSLENTDLLLSSETPVISEADLEGN